MRSLLDSNTKPPFISPVDLSHPISDSLFIDLPMNEIAGRYIHDAVSGKPGSISSSQPTRKVIVVPSKYGRSRKAITATGLNSETHLWYKNTHGTARGELAYEVCFRAHAYPEATGGYLNFLFNSRHISQGGYSGISLGDVNAVPGNADKFSVIIGGNFTTTTAQYLLEKDYHAIVNYRRPTGSTYSVDLWVDGEIVWQATGSASGPWAYGLMLTVLFNYDSGSTIASASATVHYARAWRRSLKGSEVKFLRANPFSHYMRPNGRIYLFTPSIVFKSVSDSGSGADAAAISNLISVSQTGTASQSVGITANLGVINDNSFVAIDTAAPWRLISASDSGSGSDSPSFTQNKSVSQTGAGTDSVAIAAAFGLSQAGAGADSRTLSAYQFGLPDTGESLQSVSIVRGIYLEENFPGIDSILAGQVVSKSQAGTGADAAGIAAAFGLSQAGAGADAVSIRVSLSQDETGSALEACPVYVPLSQPDAGSGSEAFSAFRVSLGLSQAASGADSVLLRPTVYPADSGSGSDSAGVTVRAPISDAGGGAASTVVSVSAPVSQAVSAVDAVNILRRYPVSDSASGADAVSIQIYVQFQERLIEDYSRGSEMVLAGAVVSQAASGADAAAIYVLVSPGDSATAVASQSIRVSATLVEDVSAAEAVTVYDHEIRVKFELAKRKIRGTFETMKMTAALESRAVGFNFRG